MGIIGWVGMGLIVLMAIGGILGDKYARRRYMDPEERERLEQEET